MTFEEKFLELATPFFNLIELADEASEDAFDRFIEVQEQIGGLIGRLADLAKGDETALESLVEFFTDEQSVEFIDQENVAPLLRVLALASNITSDTWNEEIGEEAPVRLEILGDDHRVEQPHSASGAPLNYFFHNSVDVANSVAFIDFRNNPSTSSLSSPETWTPLGQDIVEAWTVILLLENMADLDGCAAVVSSEENTEQAISYLKYHLVMRGNQLTLPMPLPTSSVMSDIQQELAITTDYTQFVEPFAMLGEINSCKNVLDTFLSSYHVLENYMIRSEVSAVLANSAGHNFQRVRDFKRLGQQTDAKEIAHLTKLFQKCWLVQIGGQELQTTLSHAMASTQADAQWDSSMFDGFLARLGLLNGNGNPITLANGFHNDESVRKNFPKLVYNIRCSVVHNKATEFHLSNEELRRNTIAALVIVKMCLPVMNRIAFGLPSSNSATNPIHYGRRELMFY